MIASSTWWTKRIRDVREDPKKVASLVERLIRSVREDEAACCRRDAEASIFDEHNRLRTDQISHIACRPLEAIDARIASIRKRPR